VGGGWSRVQYCWTSSRNPRSSFSVASPRRSLRGVDLVDVDAEGLAEE
jgi:hypothetical protein